MHLVSGQRHPSSIRDAEVAGVVPGLPEVLEEEPVAHVGPVHNSP